MPAATRAVAACVTTDAEALRTASWRQQQWAGGGWASGTVLQVGPLLRHLIGASQAGQALPEAASICSNAPPFPLAPGAESGGSGAPGMPASSGGRPVQQARRLGAGQHPQRRVGPLRVHRGGCCRWRGLQQLTHLRYRTPPQRCVPPVQRQLQECNVWQGSGSWAWRDATPRSCFSSLVSRMLMLPAPKTLRIDVV